MGTDNVPHPIARHDLSEAPILLHKLADYAEILHSTDRSGGSIISKVFCRLHDLNTIPESARDVRKIIDPDYAIADSFPCRVWIHCDKNSYTQEDHKFDSAIDPESFWYLGFKQHWENLIAKSIELLELLKQIDLPESGELITLISNIKNIAEEVSNCDPFEESVLDQIGFNKWTKKDNSPLTTDFTEKFEPIHFLGLGSICKQDLQIRHNFHRDFLKSRYKLVTKLTGFKPKILTDIKYPTFPFDETELWVFASDFFNKVANQKTNSEIFNCPCKQDDLNILLKLIAAVGMDVKDLKISDPIKASEIVEIRKLRDAISERFQGTSLMKKDENSLNKNNINATNQLKTNELERIKRKVHQYKNVVKEFKDFANQHGDTSLVMVHLNRPVRNDLYCLSWGKWFHPDIKVQQGYRDGIWKKFDENMKFYYYCKKEVEEGKIIQHEDAIDIRQFTFDKGMPDRNKPFEELDYGETNYEFENWMKEVSIKNSCIKKYDFEEWYYLYLNQSQHAKMKSIIQYGANLIIEGFQLFKDDVFSHLQFNDEFRHNYTDIWFEAIFGAILNDKIIDRFRQNYPLNHEFKCDYGFKDAITLDSRSKIGWIVQIDNFCSASVNLMEYLIHKVENTHAFYDAKNKLIDQVNISDEKTKTEKVNDLLFQWIGKQDERLKLPIRQLVLEVKKELKLNTLSSDTLCRTNAWTNNLSEAKREFKANQQLQKSRYSKRTSKRKK